MPKSSARIGCDMLYYAIMNYDNVAGEVDAGVSYQTPVRLPGIKSANVNSNSSVATNYADDGPDETADQMGEGEIELSFKDLPLEHRAALLGKELVDGIIIDKATDSAPSVAILFRSQKSNGHYRYYKVLKVRFSDPEDNHETKADSVNFQDTTLKGKFVKRHYDNKWRFIGDDDADTANTEKLSSWFDSVDFAVDTTPPTIATSVPAANSTGIAVGADLTITFSEAIAKSTINSTNVILLKDSDNTEVGCTLSQSADKKVLTINPVANLSPATAYRLIISKNITDYAGNKLANTYILKFTTA